MGLGPNGVGLLARLDRSVVLTPDFLEMDRAERGWLRRAAMIAHAKAKPKKPLAPVEAVREGKAKLWRWLGETGTLENGKLYHTTAIRAVGFKVPKWEVSK